MVLEFKWDKKIRAAQQQQPTEAPFPPEPFDIEALGSNRAFDRLKSDVFKGGIRFLSLIGRLWFPVIRSGWPLYPNDRPFVLVSRRKDVEEILARHDVFGVPYGPEM